MPLQATRVPTDGPRSANLQVLNATKTRLAASEVAVGAGVYLCWSPSVAAVFKQVGYDWLFLDLEHSAMNLETAAGLAGAALSAGITPIARVPAGDFGLGTRLLDAGAQGIVVPHVDTAAQAQQAVRSLRYPPVGGRSCGYASPLFGMRPVPPADSMRLQDEAILIVALLESKLAIENAEAIAAVPGIDVLMVGTLDLSIDLGQPGQFGSADIDAAYARVAMACKTHQKVAGMAGITDSEQLTRYAKQGVRFVLGGSDLTLLTRGAAQRLQEVRAATEAQDSVGCG